MTTYDYLKCNFTIDTYTISASLAAIRQGMPWPFGWQRLAESDPLCFESCTVPVQLLRQFECFARDWMKHDLLKGCSAIGKYEIDVDGPILTLLISRSVYCVDTVHRYPDSIQVKLAPFKNTHKKKHAQIYESLVAIPHCAYDASDPWETFWGTLLAWQTWSSLPLLLSTQWVHGPRASRNMQKLGLDYLWLKETYHFTSFFHTHRIYFPTNCNHRLQHEEIVSMWNPCFDLTPHFSGCWILRLWVHSTSSRLQVKAPLVCAASEMARHSDFDFKIIGSIWTYCTICCLPVHRKLPRSGDLWQSCTINLYCPGTCATRESLRLLVFGQYWNWTTNWAMPFDQYLCFDAKPFGRKAHTEVFLRIIFRRFTRGAELAFRCESLSEEPRSQNHPNIPKLYYESSFSNPPTPSLATRRFTGVSKVSAVWAAYPPSSLHLKSLSSTLFVFSSWAELASPQFLD